MRTCLSNRRPRRTAWLGVLLCGLATSTPLFANELAAAETLSTALQVLRSADEHGTQKQPQRAWQVVAAADANQLPLILEAMKNVGPVSENWLRAAVDTIAERELTSGGKLSKPQLEAFVLDVENSPRARRLAYEWLTKADADAPERLLGKMLDDPSLELRYDAVARLLLTAKSLEDEASKSKAYQQALRFAREKGQLRECAEALKELGQEPNMAAQLGFVLHWKVIGPFDNAERKGFDTIHLPDAIDLSAEYTGKHGPVGWKDAVAEQKDLDDLGKVDLNTALGEEKSVVGYAFATFALEEAIEVECRYESKEATKLWVNGEEVFVSNVYHSGSDFDQHIVPCKLKQGENQILIKVCQNEQTEPWTKPWDFRLRITDHLGGAAISDAIVLE